MFNERKKIVFQGMAMLVGLSLVSGGVFFLRKKQEKKDAEQFAVIKETAPDRALFAEKIVQLQQIIENNETQLREVVSKNTGEIIIKQSKQITQVIPGKTTTVIVKPVKTSKKS